MRAFKWTRVSGSQVLGTASLPLGGPISFPFPSLPSPHFSCAWVCVLLPPFTEGPSPTAMVHTGTLGDGDPHRAVFLHGRSVLVTNDGSVETGSGGPPPSSSDSPAETEKENNKKKN